MSFMGDLLRAYAAGAAAARRGERRSTCPHDPRDDDPRIRNLFTAWMRGYATVRPTIVDYSG